MILIDGSFGEGGGQIIRTALGLSLVSGKPFKIINIRAGRKKPGLRRQHLTAVNAAARIGHASVTGNNLGSKELVFVPQTILPGEYCFEVGTAGSATLVLQTVLPALISAKSASRLTLEGGTHNPFAPPFDFFQRCFVPCLNQMGLEIECSLLKYGFYPAGGGKFKVSINPAYKLNPLILKNKGRLKSVEVLGIVSRIPVKIARDEVELVCTKLNWNKNKGKAISVNSNGPGNILFAIMEYENICQVFTGFGQRGVPLQKVATDVVSQVKKNMQSDAPVEEYMADQLLIPLALVGKGSYCTSGLTRHTLTNIEVIKLFLNVEISYEKKQKNLWQIRIGGDSYGMDKK